MFGHVAVTDHVRALLGISAYQPAPPDLPGLTSPQVVRLRKAMGGNIQALPRTQTRWYLAQLESAIYQADQGQIGPAAQLMRAAQADGNFAGVMSTRTGGLVRLPKQFSGNPEIVATLERGSILEARSVFDEMCPASELELLDRDGVELGVGVAELVPVEGSSYPRLVRLDPSFLYYVWNQNQWFYNSAAGAIPVVPGDGRWVLHTPGGRMSPWNGGIWKAIGTAYIRKDHAARYKDNWEAVLANPARVAESPPGASETQSQSWFERVARWGVNTVFQLKPGYSVKLLEANGRGWESFAKTISEQNEAYTMAVAGQTVTTDGGSGFANADIHKSIRGDLIQKDAEGLAFTLNTQVLPYYTLTHFGEDALENGVTMAWDIAPPKDKTAEASSLVSASNAIVALTNALAAHGRELDIDAVLTRFGVPVVRSSQVAGNVVPMPSREQVAAMRATAEARRAA